MNVVARRPRSAKAGSAEPNGRNVEILYFASVREGLGTPREALTLPPTVATVGELLAWLRSRGPRYAAAFNPALGLRVAIDRVHAGEAAPLGTATEIAIFPMMTGG